MAWSQSKLSYIIIGGNQVLDEIGVNVAFSKIDLLQFGAVLYFGLLYITAFFQRHNVHIFDQ